MEKVVIFGASSGVRLAYSLMQHDRRYQVAAFTVDRAYLQAERFCGLPVVPFEDLETVYPPGEYQLWVAIFGSRVNKTRAEKYQQAKARGYGFIRYVHPSASVPPDLAMGENCFISDHAICRAGVTLGNNAMVMSGAMIGLDSTLEDHVYVAARATLLGENSVGEYAFIGANATVLEGVAVARECFLGAGCVIHENTQAKGVYRAAPPTLLPVASDRLGHVLFRR